VEAMRLLIAGLIAMALMAAFLVIASLVHLATGRLIFIIN
jgi:hypothetical protein